jgi:hypothetical protein
MPYRNGYVTVRDRLILTFIDRYRAATEELLREAVLSRGKRQANVSRIARRLVRSGLIHKVPYGRGKSYLVLTRRGYQAIDVAERRPRPLAEQSLPIVLAIAWHCARTGVTRFTDREFRQRYPELWTTGVRCANYYLLETPQGLQLGMFLVDRGATPRRIKSKIRRLVTQRDKLPLFDELIRSGRFRITVLTGLPAQRQNIRRYLKRHSFWNVEIEVALVPELGDLLTLD